VGSDCFKFWGEPIVNRQCRRPAVPGELRDGFQF
jgi:hypothetical protein